MAANYYSRHDYEEVDSAAANGLMSALRDKLATFPGTRSRPDHRDGDDFSYHDPSITLSAATRASASWFEGARATSIVCRAPAHRAPRCASISSVSSPTRTRHDIETQEALADLIQAADEIADIRERTGRQTPSVIT